jgi:hypothetical protein
MEINNTMEELKPKYDTKNSFYNKATVINRDNKLILVSYNTEVAYIINNRAYVYNTYSSTTLRHIKEFLKQNNFKAIDKKQILKDYAIKQDEVLK